MKIFISAANIEYVMSGCVTLWLSFKTPYLSLTLELTNPTMGSISAMTKLLARMKGTLPEM